MLKKLHIKQFKCFLDTEISFGQITALAGANGVGKSSVVQSLLLLRRIYQTYQTDEKNAIAINDKEKTFLELGSTKEIINTNASDNNIYFEIFDELEQMHKATFTRELEKPRSLKGDLEINQSSTIPFQKHIHYLNAERLGPRNTQSLTTQTFINVGFQGEYTGQAIAESRINLSPAKRVRQESPKFAKSIEGQIEAWMDFIVPDVQLEVKDFEDINQARIGIKKVGVDTDFLHPNNIGFGISYVLPIIVTGLIAEEGSLVIIENPEAHLHPFGQSRIGQFLAYMAGAGLQVVVETHSEHVINGIRIASLKEVIKPEEVIINFFSQEKKNEVEIQKITLNKKGELSEWAKGFFDQEEQDLAEIFRLTRKKKE